MNEKTKFENADEVHTKRLIITAEWCSATEMGTWKRERSSELCVNNMSVNQARKEVDKPLCAYALP